MPKSVVSFQWSVFSIISLILILLIWGFVSPTFINAQELNLATPTAADAQSDEVSVPPGEIMKIRENPNFLGQDHSYSVTFRGNGEAVVGLRVIFSNLGTLPISEYSFRVPKVIPSDLMVYQIIKDPQCYSYDKPLPVERSVPPARSGSSGSSTGITIDCLEYQAPDYYDAWGVQKYQKADIEKRGDEYVVILPQEIKKDLTGSFLLYYRAKGYTSKDLFNKYDYIFETIKINDKIENLNVGISTDSDLVLKGAMGEVDYNRIPAGREFSSFGSASSAEASPVMDRFYQNIGSGDLYKNASNLAVGESYLVKGSYADSYIKLYIKDILVYILIGLGVVVIVVMGLKFLKNKLNQSGRSPFIDWLEVGSVALLSSFFAVGYTLLIIFILNNLFRFEIDDASYGMFIGVLTMVVSVGIYFLLLVLPSVIMGAKKGMVYGLSTFGLTILLLFIYLVSIFLVSFMFQGTTDRVPFIYSGDAPLIERDGPPSLE